MDFSKIAKPTFGRAAKDDTPPVFRGKALRRRQVMFREASELIAVLPAKGESVHAVMTGQYDLMLVLAAILGKIGIVCNHLRIATLSFNDRNTSEMANLLQTGKVQSITLLCSVFFRDHNQREFANAVKSAADFPERWRLAATRSHCKVICCDFGNQKLILDGSANLRTNSNWEQLAVIMDDDLHDWHSRWIDERVNHAAAVEKEKEREKTRGD